jgi:hypothetical protein
MPGSPQLPNEFFTLQSMLTLTGATGIVFAVANGLKVAFDFNPKWLGLALSEIVAILGIVFSGGHGFDYFIGVINGFLIFSGVFRRWEGRRLRHPKELRPTRQH